MQIDTLAQLKILLNITPDSRIAIVGNAKSIFGKNHGTEIDNHDIVVRLN